VIIPKLFERNLFYEGLAGELMKSATDKLENSKTNAVTKGKVVQSQGKRAGKVAFINEPGASVIKHFVRL